MKHHEMIAQKYKKERQPLQIVFPFFLGIAETFQKTPLQNQ